MTQSYAQQPYLQDLLACVRAPALTLIDHDGHLGASPASGVYLADRRIISASLLELDGARLSPILAELDGASAARFVAIARDLGDPGQDPTVTVQRRRSVDGSRGAESIELDNASHQTVRTRISLRLACDLAEMSQVKSGQPVKPMVPEPIEHGLRWIGPDGSTVLATASPTPDAIEAGVLHWDVQLAPGESALIELDYAIAGDPRPQVVWSAGRSLITVPDVQAHDLRLPQLITQSLADLAALELADPLEPDDHFIAAGVPWYLTLFGRDSLITARMLLPLGTGLAAGTLRTLARRQGSRLDEEAAEEPGKILHELRRAEADYGDVNRSDQQLRLPPLYYGTVDATALWITLLHDSWKWGMPADEVAALIPPLERALAWMRDYGMDDSGFLRYADTTGHGLANQGWKDSADAVQFRDGRLAQAPVALAEVQAYAHAAARHGAELLDAFGRDGAQSWRDWADALALRFRNRFWLSDPTGDYPAIALDAQGKPVDTVASNMGHLLGTGLLDRHESELVARRLGSSELSSGFGLRTLGASSTGFNPLSYHCGSVWTHDTALAITGLAAAAADQIPGAAEAATTLIDGLLTAAASFGYRLPELHGGQRITNGRRATPYPASCRPQAWAAASGVAVLSAVLGPQPDAPNGTLEFLPLRPSPIGTVSTVLRFASQPISVELTADGSVR